MEEYDKRGFIEAESGFCLEVNWWERQENWEKVKEGERKFRIGDIVIGNELCSHKYCAKYCATTEGTLWTVKEVLGSGRIVVDYIDSRGSRYTVSEECFDLAKQYKCKSSYHEPLITEAKSPEQNVNVLNAFQKLFMDVDAQTLRKAGYIHEDSSLTDEGRDALDAILVKNNKAELVASAQEKLDEIEKSKE
jgi:hypothetical protein